MKASILTLFFSCLIYFLGQAQTAIETPHLIQASKNLPYGINIIWESVKGAESYAVYRAERADKRLLRLLTTVQTDRLQDRNDLKQGKRYFYAVRAIQNGQKSSFSNIDEGRLLPIAASNDSFNIDCTPLSISSVDSVISRSKGFFDLQYFIDNKCSVDMLAQNLQFYLSKDDVMDSEKDVLLAEIQTNALPANSNLRHVVRLPLPEKATIGTWQVLILRGEERKPLLSKVIVISP